MIAGNTIADNVASIEWDDGSGNYAHEDMGPYLKRDEAVEVQGGKWEITNAGGGTLNIYKSDNVTLLYSFELYDSLGARTTNPAAIVERVRV